MFPTCVVPRSVLCSGIALTLLLRANADAEKPATRVNPITEGFRYQSVPDPDVLPPVTTAPAPTTRARKRLPDPAARLPAVAINPSAPTVTATATPAAPVAPAPPGETFVLPKLTVTGQKERPPALPRVHVQAPVKNLPAPEFESPSARASRLVLKHFTPSERKFGGRSLLARAIQREAAEVAALDLNRIATALEVSAALGLEDPEELKKLRAEFLKAYYERPR